MSRSIELLLVLLLAAFTAGVVLQVKNQRLLNEILVELQRRDPIAAGHAPTPAPSVPLTPTTTPEAPPNPASKAPKIDLLNTPPVTPAQSVDPATPVTDPAPTTPTATDPAPQDPTPPAPTTDPTTDPSTPSPVAATDAAAHWQRHGPTVEKVVADLLSGGYEKVMERLDPPMKASLTRDQLATAFDPIKSEHGGLKRIAGHGVVDKGTTATMTVFTVDAELADGFVQSLTIWIDQKDRVGGLLLGKPGEAG